MKKKILGLIAIMFLLIPMALAEVNVSQTIISDGEINQEQFIQSGGNINASHYYDSNGNTYLYLNGEPVETFGTQRTLQLEQYITENDDSWSTTGMDGEDAARVVKKAVNYILGVGRGFRDFEIELAEALYSAFFTRQEASQMYESLDARLAVWEKWVEEYDHDGYCHAKALVAQERGYKDFHCHDDEWYHIEPDYEEGIRVEPYVPEE